MLDSAGVKYSRAGENIATTGSVSRAHPLFMGSSGHRATFSIPATPILGLGVVKRGVTYYVTQIFIKK